MAVMEGDCVIAHFAVALNSNRHRPLVSLRGPALPSMLVTGIGSSQFGRVLPACEKPSR